jgi:predicted ATPase/class 3 adenylate cyclase
VGQLPTGTVTFLFTDLEASTRLWEEHPEAMKAALARHDEILREAVAAHDGDVVKSTGDGYHAVFRAARDAVDAAVAAQHALAAADWATGEPLKVRMGVHTGEAQSRDGDYYGTATNRAARLMSVAHGEQILVSLSTEELLSDALPEGLALVDLGEQRLRDLSRPERIFQVAEANLRSEFPAIRTVDAFPGNLPFQVTSFVGRQDELVELSKVLRDSRLVTLTGTGGVGKTRLAVQLAAELLQRFPDGAWLFELAAVSDADAMVQAIATTLSVPPRPGVTLESALLEFLRSKRALVLLDNCEHLLDPAGRFAAGIVRECEHVRVVATSREALAIAGERVWPLLSLPLPGAAMPASEVESTDAGRLFCERAESARPGFVVDETNASAVAEICRRLDGIPLALELAAARLVAMTPTEIAALLDERFRLLTGGRRAAVERHRTLRAAVEWSYGLLGPVDRTVFDRLGVFAGTFDAGAAMAVVGADDLDTWDVLDALSSLVAKSMLEAETGPADTTRYRMLETLRQHAHEQLDHAGAADEFRRRHAQNYARFAEEAGAALVGPEELAWRARVNVERDNLRAAVYWALDRDEDADTLLALRIVASLAHEAVTDPPGGIGAWAERSVEVATRSSERERTVVLAAAAFQASNLAQHDLVRSRAASARQDGIVADTSVPWLLIFAENWFAAQQGDHLGAMRGSVEAADELTQAGTDGFGLVMVRCAASFYAIAAGDLVTARAQAKSALEVARRTNNPSGLSSALYNLGRSIEDDEPVRALDAYEQAIALGRAGATQIMMGPALAGVARLRSDAQDRAATLEALHDAITYSSHLGWRPMLAEVLGPGAEILVRVGERATATVLAGSVLEGVLAEINVSLERNASIERTLVTARADLGDEHYSQLFARGAAMSYEEVVEFALDGVRRAMTETSGA